jgi:hypothetical protein
MIDAPLAIGWVLGCLFLLGLVIWLVASVRRKRP